MKNEVAILAAREADGWGLTVGDEPATFAHVRTLDKARPHAIAYLDSTDPDVDHADWVIHVVPEDRGVAQRVRTARENALAAARAQEDAARGTRSLVTSLDQERYKSADIAGLLGISRGRVSQLLSEARVGQ